MSIIYRIRTKAGLLLSIIIGISLFLFILTDFITSGGFLYSKSKQNVAEINGTNISYTEYQNMLAQIEHIMKLQYQTNTLDEAVVENMRNQVWQDLIQKYLLDKEYKKLGLSLSDEELYDLIQGPNPHPLIMDRFRNPETGTVNRLQLSGFLSNIEQMQGPEKQVWLFYENIINKDRLFTKYNNLIRKGLYVNSLEASRRVKDMNKSVDFSFIQKPYTEISDSSIVISKKDIRKYYNDYKEHFTQTESRDIKYVAFDIIPSSEDFENAEAWINEVKPQLEEVEDVEQFVTYTSPPYDGTNYKQGDLPSTLDSFAFVSKLGDVYGPYFEDNTYKLAKLAKINYLPDSIKASHILLPADQSNVQQARAFADSLLKLAKDGYNFATLASDNSLDRITSLSGGDLGWFHEGFKGKFFSDSAFSTNLGDVKLTFSEEGFHIVKVTDKSKPVKKVQLGIIKKEVTPSSKTDQYYYSKAMEFASTNNTLEKFEAAVADNDPVAIPVYNIMPLDNNVYGLENSRSIIHWAFNEAEEGSIIKNIDNYGNKYVVAVVTKVYNKGYKSIEMVSEEIARELMKQKKAEKISEDMTKAIAGVSDIDHLANSLNLKVNSASDIKFTSFAIPGAGAETKVIGAVVNAPQNELSSPVAGENGVFIFTVDNINESEDEAITSLAKSYIERSYLARAVRQGYEALTKLAKIEDKRYRFY